MGTLGVEKGLHPLKHGPTSEKIVGKDNRQPAELSSKKVD
jgi:hypothetical protein